MRIKSVIAAAFVAILSFAIALPAIAADNSSGVGLTNENYNNSPSAFVPAVSSNTDANEQLPENCDTPVKAVGIVTIVQNGDQVNVNGSGGRGNLGHKYDTSKWCIVAIGTHRDGDVIAMSRSKENTSRPAPGIKFGRIASVGSGRIR